MGLVNNVNGITRADISSLQSDRHSAFGSEAKNSIFEGNEQDDNHVQVQFKSEDTLKKEGKTRHMFAAKDGPDKGSKFYSDEDYDMWGNYKPNKKKK